MRWLFIFVLFLNLAYIAWEMSRPVSDTYSNIQVDNNNVQPIVLLSEVSREPVVETPQNQLDKVAGKQGGDQQVTGLEQSGAEQVAAEHVAVDKAKTELPAADQTGRQIIETASLPKKEPPAQTQARKNSCYTMGPFRDLDVLRELTREIKPYVVTVDFRGSEAKELPLYWVYLTPERNRGAAIATGKRLKSNQIKDYFIILKGEKTNGISLGYFRNKAGASALTRKVNKLGFDVVLETVIKTRTVYWLDFQVADDVKIPESIFDKYIKAAKKDRIKRLERDCTV